MAYISHVTTIHIHEALDQVLHVDDSVRSKDDQSKDSASQLHQMMELISQRIGKMEAGQEDAIQIFWSDLCDHFDQIAEVTNTREEHLIQLANSGAGNEDEGALTGA